MRWPCWVYINLSLTYRMPFKAQNDSQDPSLTQASRLVALLNFHAERITHSITVSNRHSLRDVQVHFL